jgi:solute carrier family 25 phosphate transporter 23/24/25/41
MMLFGAVAGCAAEFSTYPFEVIRRRMQMQMGTSSVSSAVGMKALRRMTKTLRVILNSRGIPGLYAGCVPGIAQVLPSAALGYYSYEMFKIVLDVD